MSRAQQIKAVLFPARSTNRKAAPVMLAEAWAALKPLAEIPTAKRARTVSYEQDGKAVTLQEEFEERYEECKRQTLDFIVPAFLGLDAEFFEHVARELRRTRKAKSGWPDKIRLALLKAATDGARVNLSQLAQRLTEANSNTDTSSTLRQLQRLAREYGIRVMPRGRPRK